MLKHILCLCMCCCYFLLCVVALPLSGWITYVLLGKWHTVHKLVLCVHVCDTWSLKLVRSQGSHTYLRKYLDARLLGKLNSCMKWSLHVSQIPSLAFPVFRKSRVGFNHNPPGTHTMCVDVTLNRIQLTCPMQQNWYGSLSHFCSNSLLKFNAYNVTGLGNTEMESLFYVCHVQTHSPQANYCKKDPVMVYSGAKILVSEARPVIP